MGHHLRTNLPCSECSSSDAMVEYDTHFWCFSCQAYISKSGADRRRAVAPKEDRIEYPEDLIRDPRQFHVAALKWLYKYKIFDDQIKLYGISYLPEVHRVFIPTKDEKGNLLSYQTRSLSYFDTPKYLGKGSKSLFHSKQAKTTIIVLVEDALSCIRVGEYLSCVSLQGTSLRTEDIPAILKYNEILLWLDGDKAGKTASRKLKKQLSMYKECTALSTPKDPKEHSRRHIKSLLGV